MKKEIKLSVRKTILYEKVQQESAYVGAKSDNEGDYEKMSAIDEDRSLFESYWSEASSFALNALKPFLKSTGNVNNGNGLMLESDFEAVLLMPENFDEGLADSMNGSLVNFFTSYISAKWFEKVNPDIVERYSSSATAFLGDLKNKMYYRKRPIRR